MKLKIATPFIIIIMIFLLVGASNASQSQERLNPGLELSLALKETLANQRADVEDFIFKAKYDRAEKEERLKLIEERQIKFNAALDEIAKERSELKDAHENRTITQEAFTAGMKTLGLEVALSAKTVKELDDDIVELKKHIEDKHKQKFSKIEENHNELKNRTREDVEIEEKENETKDETPTSNIPISKEAAIEMAKRQFAPDAVVKDATLKTDEHNQVFWQLELSKPDGTEIEVLIDGTSGNVLKMDVKNEHNGNVTHEVSNESQKRGEK